MLTVDVDTRITIDECLEHPWVTNQPEIFAAQYAAAHGKTAAATHPHTTATDSSESLSGAMGKLDFSKRKPKRERTMLSTMNTVRVQREVPLFPKDPHKSDAVKVYVKNNEIDGGGKEVDQRTPAERDGAVFGQDGKSIYAPGQAPRSDK